MPPGHQPWPQPGGETVGTFLHAQLDGVTARQLRAVLGPPQQPRTRLYPWGPEWSIRGPQGQIVTVYRRQGGYGVGARRGTDVGSFVGWLRGQLQGGRRAEQLPMFGGGGPLDCDGLDYGKRPCAERRLQEQLARWRTMYPPPILAALRTRVDDSQGWGWTVEAAVPAAVLGPGPWEVLTATAANPDLMHGQGTGTGYWAGSQPLEPTWHRARSIGEAAMIARSYIDRSGIGGGNWTGGAIRRAGAREPVARVSYNGRVWLAGQHPTPEVVFGGGGRAARPGRLSRQQALMVRAYHRTTDPHEWDELRTRLQLDGIDPAAPQVQRAAGLRPAATPR